MILCKRKIIVIIDQFLSINFVYWLVGLGIERIAFGSRLGIKSVELDVKGLRSSPQTKLSLVSSSVRRCRSRSLISLFTKWLFQHFLIALEHPRRWCFAIDVELQATQHRNFYLRLKLMTTLSYHIISYDNGKIWGWLSYFVFCNLCLYLVIKCFSTSTRDGKIT